MLLVATALFAAEARVPVHSGELRVWFFDIGQGDATFVQTPDGHQLLIDGGPDDAVLAKLGAVMGPLDRSLDLVLATHPDADHIGGLASVLARYEVAEVATNGDDKRTSIADGFDAARDAETGARIGVVRAGDAWTFGDVTLEAVWPATDEDVAREDANDASVVLLLTYGDATVLLTGDAPAAAEARFASLAGDVDVLRAGHHGSATSSAFAFLRDVAPEVAIISSGVDNRYGHPHPAVLQRFLDLGIAVLRTDLDGDILLTSDGGEPVISAAPLPF